MSSDLREASYKRVSVQMRKMNLKPCNLDDYSAAEQAILSSGRLTSVQNVVAVLTHDMPKIGRLELPPSLLKTFLLFKSQNNACERGDIERPIKRRKMSEGNEGA
eukprot:912454-Amphidinium_carterae.1